MILAPLRGVTIRCFREVFAEPIRAAGFTEAITPFIAAIAGYDPLKDRELCRCRRDSAAPAVGAAPAVDADSPPLLITPQFIGKDPAALRICLEKIKGAGYGTADLNCGCPYPMVRCKGRGAGILKTPDVLRAMLDVGCSVMGEGRFSVKTRLGVERSDELLSLMPVLNAYPLRFLTVHARTARQMYGGPCDWAAFAEVEKAAKIPLVRNGDLPLPPPSTPTPSPTPAPQMIGRSFIVALGERDDIGGLLRKYVEASAAELSGDASVLGRLKELIAYWKLLPAWHRRWNVIKLCRTTEELLSSLPEES